MGFILGLVQKRLVKALQMRRSFAKSLLLAAWQKE